MAGKRWLGVVGVAVLVAGSGCVSCAHQLCKPVFDAGPNCEAPECDRRHVYAVLVNGLTPGGPSGLEGLRDSVAQHGYDKVYYGQLYHVWWFWSEMKRVHKEDPSARFVLVGYDFGCGPVEDLARDAAAKGIPVDAVVLLDPIAKPVPVPCPACTAVLRCPAGVACPHDDGTAVPDATHLTLPTRLRTIDVVCGLLNQTAARVEHPPYYEEAEVIYPDAPPPRPTAPSGAGLPADWYFLYDMPGNQPQPLPPLPVPLNGLMGFPAPEATPAPPPVGQPLPLPRKWAPAVD